MVAHSLRRHTISFRHAFDGIKEAFTNQPNFRVHCLAGVMVVAVGWFFRLSAIEWLIITFTIMWVILAEMMNTMIEALVDLITEEYRQSAKIAKDVAAGTVLLSAVGAIIVAIIIFLPKIIQLMDLS